MAIKLANNESIVASYPYAKGKGKGNHTSCELIVTNRRVINSSEGKRCASYEDIPLKAAERVNVSYGIKLGGFGIFLIVLGTIVALLGLAAGVLAFVEPEGLIVELFGEESVLSSVGIIFGVGAVLIVLGIILAILLKSAKLSLALSSSGLSEQTMVIGKAATAYRKKSKKKVKAMKIKVSPKVVKQMAEELCAVIMDARG